MALQNIPTHNHYITQTREPEHQKFDSDSDSDNPVGTGGLLGEQVIKQHEASVILSVRCLQVAQLPKPLPSIAVNTYCKTKNSTSFT